MNSEIKKWKVSLFLFYQYFNARRESVTASDLFHYERSTLAKYGILSESALKHHASNLAERHYLYTVKNKRKPFDYSIPYQFMVSKLGLKRLAFENLISQRDQDRLTPYVHWEALENGIKVRG